MRDKVPQRQEAERVKEPQSFARLFAPLEEVKEPLPQGDEHVDTSPLAPRLAEADVQLDELRLALPPVQEKVGRL